VSANDGVIVQRRVLVVGCGSIGRRHLRNLRSLGMAQLAGCDPSPSESALAQQEVQVRVFPDLRQAVLEFQPEIVFVCTPPVYHVSQATAALRADAHVFIEKPLSHSLENIEELAREACERHRIVQVGYNLRFHPGLQRIKRLLDENAVGRVLWARAEFGQYLPDWRPSQDHRQSYTANRALGGGIILDASHELDYMLWLMGQAPTEILCMTGMVSELGVDVEDCATLLLRFSNGAQADIHVDFVQRGYSRTCKIAGETGTISWDYTQNQVILYRAELHQSESFPYDFQSNDMYIAEVKAFLYCTNMGVPPAVDLQQARTVLEVALAAKTAAQLRKDSVGCAS